MTPPRIATIGRVKRACLLTAILCGVAGAASAESRLYRWTDAQGHVHYGDQPSSGNAQEVRPKSAPAAATAAATTRSSSDSRAASPGAPTIVGTNPDDCQRKKDLLTSYRGAARINETNNLGETREYTEEQRQRLIENAEQAVRAACDPA